MSTLAMPKIDQSVLNDKESIVRDLKKENIVVLHLNNSPKFKEDPKNFTNILDICTTAHSSNSIDSTFCAFNTFKGEVLVAWGTPSKTLDIYNLKKRVLSKSIPNAHNSTIFSCRHYQDFYVKNDLIATSSLDQSVKVWSVNENFANILHIKSAASVNYIYSVSILCEKFEKKN